MKKWTIAISFGVLILSFQNCSKSNFGTNDSASSAQVNPVVESSVTSLKPADAEVLQVPSNPFIDAGLSNVSAKTEDSNLFASKSLAIHTKTGVVDVVLPDGSLDESQQFCLKSEQISQLEGLLSASALCDAQVLKTQSEYGCSMEYAFPYAILQFSDKTVKLGEKFSGCHKGADLCGENSKNLKLFLNNLVQALGTLAASKCNFENL